MNEKIIDFNEVLVKEYIPELMLTQQLDWYIGKDTLIHKEDVNPHQVNVLWFLTTYKIPKLRL